MNTRKLTFYERLLLHYVKSFSKNKKTFFISNKKIAEIFDLSEPSICSMISRLVADGYLTKSKVDGVRYLKYTGKEYTQIPLLVNFSSGELNVLKKKATELENEVLSLKIENEELKNKLNSIENH